MKKTDRKNQYWAVTGTFHGSLVEAVSEGQARRIFHKQYKGESITHIRNCAANPFFDFLTKIKDEETD